MDVFGNWIFKGIKHNDQTIHFKTTIKKKTTIQHKKWFIFICSVYLNYLDIFFFIHPFMILIMYYMYMFCVWHFFYNFVFALAFWFVMFSFLCFVILLGFFQCLLCTYGSPYIFFKRLVPTFFFKHSRLFTCVLMASCKIRSYKQLSSNR